MPRRAYALLAMTNNGLRPPRNDKISSGIASPPFFVIANEGKQSYIGVNEIATGTTSPRNDKKEQSSQWAFLVIPNAAEAILH